MAQDAAPLPSWALPSPWNQQGTEPLGLGNTSGLQAKLGLSSTMALLLCIKLGSKINGNY